MTTQKILSNYFSSSSTFVKLDSNNTLVIGQQNDWENRPFESFVIPNSFAKLENPLNSLLAQYSEDYVGSNDPLTPFVQEHLEEITNILFANHTPFEFYATQENSPTEILALQNKLETMYPNSAQEIALAFTNLF